VCTLQDAVSTKKASLFLLGIHQDSSVSQLVLFVLNRTSGQTLPLAQVFSHND
jgi:hypothetical protein